MTELSIELVSGLAIKLYALMTPTAVLSAFIHHTRAATRKTRFAIAWRCALAIFILGEFLLFFGARLFNVFGFTLDAFRIGAGLLLFLNAIRLMNEDDDGKIIPESGGDISVVPLAIPLGMGPSAIGTVMIMGAAATDTTDFLATSIGLFIAALGMALLLCLSTKVKKLIGRTGITVMAKLTALLLSAIAAQVIFSGVRAFIQPH